MDQNKVSLTNLDFLSDLLNRHFNL